MSKRFTNHREIAWISTPRLDIKDPVRWKKLIERSVIISCGVEGIKIELKKKQSLNKPRNKKAQ